DATVTGVQTCALPISVAPSPMTTATVPSLRAAVAARRRRLGRGRGRARPAAVVAAVLTLGLRGLRRLRLIGGLGLGGLALRGLALGRGALVDRAPGGLGGRGA